MAASTLEVCAEGLALTLEAHHAFYVGVLVRGVEAVRAAAPWQLVLATLILSSLLYNHGRMLGWVWLSAVILTAQGVYVVWQVVMIGWNLVMYTGLKWVAGGFYVYESLVRWCRGGSIRLRWSLRRRLRAAASWPEYREAASGLDALDGKGEWREAEGDNAAAVVAATRQLRVAREAGDIRELERLLRAMMQRNHMQVDSKDLHAECKVGSKAYIEAYVVEQVAALEFIVTSESGGGLSVDEKLEFFHRCSVCLGHTALCLSGGGSLSMYHMGVVKALIENSALPTIISGTSGGAIVAGMLAIHTDEEMLRDVVQSDISQRYPERWFPPMERQLYSYLKHGCLVEHDDFSACCRAYYKEITFQEAFERTGRIVNINVSQSSTGHRGALLLNHLTAPHVLIRSAVHASCCLPTVMHPTALLAKGADGQTSTFGDEQAQFIDGSFTADIPRKRLSELFHVTQDIVSQVNPHVVATMNSFRGTTSRYSVFRHLEASLANDALHRLQVLAKLRLLPAMYGGDLSRMAMQRYLGDATILPSIGGPGAVLRMVQNPDRRQMATYIREGQRAAFSQMSRVQHLLALERALNSGLARLLAQSDDPSPPASPDPPAGGAAAPFQRLKTHRRTSSGTVIGSIPDLRRRGSKPARLGVSQNGVWSSSFLSLSLEQEARKANEAGLLANGGAHGDVDAEPLHPPAGALTPVAHSDVGSPLHSPCGSPPSRSPAGPSLPTTSPCSPLSAAAAAALSPVPPLDSPPRPAAPDASARRQAERVAAPVGMGDGDDTNSGGNRMLLARSMLSAKALQELSREKEELHVALAKQEAVLGRSEELRAAAETRADLYAEALAQLQGAAKDALARGKANAAHE